MVLFAFTLLKSEFNRSRLVYYLSRMHRASEIIHINGNNVNAFNKTDRNAYSCEIPAFSGDD